MNNDWACGRSKGFFDAHTFGTLAQNDTKCRAFLLAVKKKVLSDEVSTGWQNG